jgi:hypothetical protein
MTVVGDVILIVVVESPVIRASSIGIVVVRVGVIQIVNWLVTSVRRIGVGFVRVAVIMTLIYGGVLVRVVVVGVLVVRIVVWSVGRVLRLYDGLVRVMLLPVRILDGWAGKGLVHVLLRRRLNERQLLDWLTLLWCRLWDGSVSDSAIIFLVMILE